MSKHDQHQHSVRTNSYADHQHQEKDADDMDNEKWNPSPEAFQAFVKQDYLFARENVKHALHSAGRPVTMKEIKDSTLHLIDCIEKVLSSFIASTTVTEVKGRYSLVKS